MILTRTPLRLPLGGGSTDLPAYYEQFGGFIFAVSINLYMYLGVNQPPGDDLIRVKYRESEEVERLEDLRHNLARGALARTGISKKIEITSMSDVSDGTGLGSSAAYLVGLLSALHAIKGENISRRQLAEEAFEIATRDLGLPDGKQDFYPAAFGNFCVLEIAPNGSVVMSPAHISQLTQEQFEERTLLFYTGIRRSSVDLLHGQQTDIRAANTRAIELKHQTKTIGRQILKIFEAGKLDNFGELMHEHWNLKKQMAPNMSANAFDEVYSAALNAGAIGGKIIGAGGGGFFLVYCKDGKQSAVRQVFANHKMREIPYRVDAGGTQVLVNHSRDFNTI